MCELYAKDKKPQTLNKQKNPQQNPKPTKQNKFKKKKKRQRAEQIQVQEQMKTVFVQCIEAKESSFTRVGDTLAPAKHHRSAARWRRGRAPRREEKTMGKAGRDPRDKPPVSQPPPHAPPSPRSAARSLFKG